MQGYVHRMVLRCMHGQETQPKDRECNEYIQIVYPSRKGLFISRNKP